MASRSPRKLKNGVSYDKVIELLSNTQDFKNEKSAVQRRVANIRVERLKFDADWKGNPECYVIAAFGTDDEVLTQRFRCETSAEYEMIVGVNSIINEANVKAIVDKNFGVTHPGFSKPAVPTYFCNPERVKEILWNKARGLFNFNYDSNEFRTVKERLRQIRVEILASDEFANGMKKCRDDYTVEEIKKVLMRFKEASPELLKRALGAFVVESVMED